jgi:diguanylate cyclase (GGDEF)-like protein/PAS domain S-box-containing protein
MDIPLKTLVTFPNQEKMSISIDAIEEVILLCDRDGRIESLNKAAADFFEYSLEELVGQSIEKLIEDIPFTHCVDFGFLLFDWLSSQDIICLTKSGKKVSVSFSCSSLDRETDTLQTFICIGRDMTERQQAELQLRQQGDRERLLRRITWHIRQSLSLDEILKKTVAEVRQFLNCDRVLITRLDSANRMHVEVESVEADYPSILGSQSYNRHFTKNVLMRCKLGKIIAIENVVTSSLLPDDFDILSQFQVKAKLVVPIMIAAPKEDDNVHPPPRLGQTRLWGLLIAHHCQNTRQWQKWEIDLLEQLAVQVAIAIQQAELYEQLQAANRELKQLAISDGLTQISNRRHFNQSLQSEWKRLARERSPLSIILCDIDYFKLYNDTYGHLAGDTCLQQVAQVLRCATHRPADLAARYGGEEFVIMLPNTDLAGAVRVAELIRSQMRRLAIAHINSPVKPRVTLSLGVASRVPSSHLSPESLIRAADLALYRAKALGRDRWCTDESQSRQVGDEQCSIHYPSRLPISEDS